MKLLDFMNTEKNWREILSSPPYNIKITEGYAQNGTYVILKYNLCRKSVYCSLSPFSESTAAVKESVGNHRTHSLVIKIYRNLGESRQNFRKRTDGINS
jgi:hypothetical protein